MDSQRNGFVPATVDIETHEAVVAERDRLAELLASARDRNASLIEQRETEREAWARGRVEAAYGRALLRLVGQLRRLRREADAGRVPFLMDREAVMEAAHNEIEESWGEAAGSDPEAHEIVDSLAAVLQMFVGTGRGDADLLAKLGSGGDRLAERLDLVAAGLTWQRAKLAQRCGHERMPDAIAALLNATTAADRLDAANDIMDLAGEWLERDR